MKILNSMITGNPWTVIDVLLVVFACLNILDCVAELFFETHLIKAKEKTTFGVVL